jgi:hypothetical protein
VVAEFLGHPAGATRDAESPDGAADDLGQFRGGRGVGLLQP